MVKSLETLALEKLTIKCKQDQYEYDESTDLDLMADCSNGIFLQSCNRNDKFLCECQEWRYYSKCEELKKSDLTEYCLIGTFLQSWERNSYLLCECQKWDCFSEQKPFCDSCLFNRDMTMFSYEFFDMDRFSRISKIVYNFHLFHRILDYWNDLNKKVFDDLFYFLDLE